MLTKIKSILSNIGTDLADTWNRSKIYILALGAVVLTFEFQKLKQFLLAYEGKKEIQADDKKDQKLATAEKNESDQADALAKQAKDLPNQQKPVDENWNKEKP
jgi:hypothetical protein